MNTLRLAVVSLGILFAGCRTTADRPTENMLRGWVSRADIMSRAYPRFNLVFDTVKVSTDVVDLLRESRTGIGCVVFFGTWCSDSWREVPRFLRIMDLGGIDSSAVTFYAVDRSKKSTDGVTDRYPLEMIPTFIFFRDGVEVGRIVEKPPTVMEDEMLRIYGG